MESILIVEDEVPVRRLLGHILAARGYTCDLAADAAQGRQILQKKNFSLVISDINMPGESGLDFMRHVLQEFPDTAGIMATGVDDRIVAEAALEMGVYDYIVKPIERNNVLISVANALRRRELEISNRNHRLHLEQVVAQRTDSLNQSMKKLRQALDGVIHTMVHTIEIRDPYTAGHQQRVAQLAVAVAREMGLPPERIEGIQMGGIIHDLGKISVPAEILSKPGRLTDIEFSLIKTHPQVGYEILKEIEFPGPSHRWFCSITNGSTAPAIPRGCKGRTYCWKQGFWPWRTWWKPWAPTALTVPVWVLKRPWKRLHATRAAFTTRQRRRPVIPFLPRTVSILRLSI